MIDDTGVDLVRDPAVMIEGSQITHVGSSDQILFDTKKDKVIDMGEAALMPGLIDSHCHLFSMFPVPKNVKTDHPEPVDLSQLVVNGTRTAQWWLSPGVTTVRDMGMAMN
jgi:imidazolonepropionase-like amidohydrolase